MPVLVTGAAGLLGSHVTDLLLERGESVRALVREGEQVPEETRAKVEVLVGDMGDGESLRRAVSGVDRVFHCAARTGPWGPKADYATANVSGLKMLVDLSLAAGVRRFVHVSSITVHGNDVDGTANEDSPLRVEPNPYSQSKVAGERLLNHLMPDRSAPVTIVRPGLIYGPRDRGSFSRFAQLVQAGKMVVFGSGENYLPLIYVRDVALGLLLAGERPQAAGRTYILVNDEPVTQNEYLGAIARGLGVAPPARHIPYRLALLLGGTAEMAFRAARLRRPPPVMRYGVQMLGGNNRFMIDRARAELGFSPTVGLAEGVDLSLAWYRSLGRADSAQG
jgi:nucleoside-diphosphate-sugar epimerase